MTLVERLAGQRMSRRMSVAIAKEFANEEPQTENQKNDNRQKTAHGSTIQAKTRHDTETRQDTTRQDEPRQCKTRHVNTRKDKTRWKNTKNKTRQQSTSQSQTPMVAPLRISRVPYNLNDVSSKIPIAFNGQLLVNKCLFGVTVDGRRTAGGRTNTSGQQKSVADETLLKKTAWFPICDFPK
jgi:hypothetical protein